MTTRKTNWPAIVLAAAFCIFAGTAMREIAKLQPAVVATIDIERLFNQLEERTAAERELDDMRRSLNQEITTRTQALKRLEEEVELWPTTNPKHQEALEKFALEGAQFRAFVEHSRRRIEFNEARTLRRIYVNIKRAVADEATANGYDVVFVNDAVGDIPMSDVAETTRQISARRMLYSNPGIDITEDVVARMNNEFKAANPG